MELQLTPLFDDPRELGVENGLRLWGAHSIDPAFIAAAPKGEPLKPGWYRATALLERRGGDIVEPRIYIPDAAGGCSEQRAVTLVRKGGAYGAELFVPQPVDHLRFDPSSAPCEFGCNALSVESIAMPSRPRGLWPWSPRAAASPDREQKARRKARVLASIDREGLGIEIGPSHDPIAPKREGFRVHVIDHASQAELRAKYAGHGGVVIDNIEEVDFVWRGQSYLELTGRPHHYDWIVASNLVEHTPDLVAFLADCDSILKDTGVLVLVIPDKRYCFDRFRPITGLARVLDCHLPGNRIHTAGAVAEYLMNVATRGGRHSWDPQAQGEYEFPHSVDQARDMIREVREHGTYHDIHNWVFVPHSFRLLLEDLHALGYTRLREVAFQPTEGYEFHVTLGRHGGGPGKSRRDLMRAIDAELAATEAPPRAARLRRLLGRR